MITSTSNIQVKELLRLQKKSREREKEGVFIVEGPRMAEEIPRERIVKLYVSESFQAKCVKEKNDRFIQEAEVMSDRYLRMCRTRRLRRESLPSYAGWSIRRKIF